MTEREIDWGGSNSPYRTTFDKNDDGRARLVEDTGGNVVLLEYDESAFGGSGGFVCRGPVEMSGNDVTGVGAFDATSISANKILNAQGSAGLNYPGSGWQTISSSLDTVLFLELFASNSSGTTAKIVVEVDTDGDSTAEFTPQITPPDTGSAYGTFRTMTIPLPAGAQIQFDNARDPNGTNSIESQFYYSTN